MAPELSIPVLAADAMAEWPATLDVPALLEDGWRPTPFREFVLKVHSRCNLACDYCYMYEMADQSWRAQPRQMSSSVVGDSAVRIAEHVRSHELDTVSVVLHGGEPLLAGPALISDVVMALRAEIGDTAELTVSVQTNGVLLGQHLPLLARLGVGVGVSLDGNGTGHDRHRRFASGRGSYDRVSAGLRLLAGDQYRHLFNGLLCVIDAVTDPVGTYLGMLEFDPPRVDFLLPHGNWAAPPPGRFPEDGTTPYADWLITIFDRWYESPATEVRLFAEIIRLLLGRPSQTESVGLAPASFLVIETDGSLAQVDSLRATFHGAPATGLHVSRDSFDSALLLPAIVARQLGFQSLCVSCQNCRLWRVCGGGLYVHRYRPGAGFLNPSVYCPDLMRLIYHIRARVEADIASRLGQR